MRPPSTRALLCALSLAASLGAAPPLAQAQAQPPLDLKFASFFRQPVGPRGLEISDELRAADGQVVRVTGYMVSREDPLPGSFMLTPRPVRMSEHADGDADDLPPATVLVLLDASQGSRAVVHQAGLVTVTGRLAVGRAEGSDGRVSWVRLQLAPQAEPSHPLSVSLKTP